MKDSTFLHTLGTEGGAVAAGLGMKAVASRALAGRKFADKLAKSKFGHLASKYIWNSVVRDKNGKVIRNHLGKPTVIPVTPGVLVGEAGEYAGSFGAVYGALKLKEHQDRKKFENQYLQKAACFIRR